VLFRSFTPIKGIGSDFVGRPHRVTDNSGGKLINTLVNAMIKSKKAVMSKNESISENSQNKGHWERVGNQTLVDSKFINLAKGVLPNSELVHLGGGDFALKTSDGEIVFSRTSKPVGIADDFVGRVHRMTDNKGGKLLNNLVQLMGKSKKAVLSMSEAINELKSGDKLVHKHNPKIEIELIEPTNKGWKVYQIENGKKKIAHFDKQDISGTKALFESGCGCGCGCGGTKPSNSYSLSEFIVKESRNVPKMYVKYLAVQKKVNELETIQKEMAKKYFAETELNKKNKLLQDLKAGTKLLASFRKNLFNIENKYVTGLYADA
jgi:hypothetical protein